MRNQKTYFGVLSTIACLIAGAGWIAAQSVTGVPSSNAGGSAGGTIASGTAPLAAYYSSTSGLSSTPYPMAFMGTPFLASATASGTTNYVGLSSPVASFAAAVIPNKVTLIDNSCTVRSWTIYSDVGPGGTPTDATATFSIVAFQFTPGTANPLSTGSYAALDSSLTVAATGVSPLNSTITSFTVNPLVIPAHSYVGIMSVTSGGVDTTTQMNIHSIMDCR